MGVIWAEFCSLHFQGSVDANKLSANSFSCVIQHYLPIPCKMMQKAKTYHLIPAKILLYIISFYSLLI